MGTKLNQLKVKSLTKTGRYGDGDGLWLQVRSAEHRSWLLRYQWGDKARQMGLGAYPEVGLSEARDRARGARALIRDNKDPIAERRAAKAAARVPKGMTFRQCADRFLDEKGGGGTNEKHQWQWRQTLDLACKQIGKLTLAEVNTEAVLRVLQPIWKTKTETASRLRGRLERVLDFATARGWRSGDNPCRWRGHLSAILETPSQVVRVEHHAALPYRDVAAFMGKLRAEDGTAALALRFTILTAARTGEVIGARWSEVDLTEAIWTVPADRMKAKRPHRVPLSDPAIAVLHEAAKLRRDDTPAAFVFPGGKGAKSEVGLSNVAMLMLLRRMKRDDITTHGFRSTFRDWCAEATDHPREVAEAALAHVLDSKVEAAYQRGDLFDKRRRLMDDWAKHCSAAGAVSQVAS